MSRSSKREKRFKDNKEARRLLKNYNDLWNQSNKDVALIPLDKPIRVGFERTFVIRPDILRSPKKTIISSILPIVDNKVFCKTRKFVAKDWKTGKMKPIEQELTVLDERRYMTLTEQQKTYFQKEYRKTRRWHGGMEISVVYAFRFPWMFEYQIKPSYITHRGIPNSDAESERTKIGDKLWQQAFAYKSGIAERGSWWYSEGKKLRDKAMKRVVASEMKEGYEWRNGRS